ncbi:hypothetical protein B9Z55_027813 [Caenorhabditis nigoni]|uniref:SPK domain-containing protein n=1 Tax=Caenorhabditis nigoni TaxID=1611254 RepID=A0A2G5SER8_9PELO|nr:hypothetical protein B9Z55_027813 [Caenorhabditis nigoni]
MVAEGYTLLEKVHLVFIFSWPVSNKVQKEKCAVQLDRAKRISYFRSEDGSVVLSSDHNEDEKFFKGTLLTPKRQRSLLYDPTNKSKEVRPSQPTDPEPADDANENDPESEELESSTNVSDSQNSKLSRIQNGAFNGRINYDELDEQELEDMPVLKPEMKEDENRNTSTNQKSNLKTEEDVDALVGKVQQEAPFYGRINYDDLDNGEHPEFMVPVGYQLLDNQNKRHLEPSQDNAKRLRIEKSRESGLVDSPEINDVEMRSGEVEEAQELEQSSEVSNEPTCRVNNESEIQNQVAPVGDQSIGNNRLQKFIQNGQKRVKIEEFLEEIEKEPEVLVPEEQTEMPPPATISLLKLSEQIETYAFNMVLDESFQQKTVKAVLMFNAIDQTIPIQEFNLLFNGMLAGLKRERIQNSTRNSIQLVRLFKQLRRNLIGPMGEEIMAEALGILDEEIQKLEGNEDEIPLKTVQIKLDSLMGFITNSWADLDE